MVLLKEKIKLSCGREIELKELSFMERLELNKQEQIHTMDYYKKCMSEEDFNYLNEVNHEDSVLLSDALAKVNRWNKKEDESDEEKNLKG